MRLIVVQLLLDYRGLSWLSTERIREGICLCAHRQTRWYPYYQEPGDDGK